ncbi:MAG TPA: Uma2 family endonuclease [Egibacteraceae bacterium]|nr:Uma2 family endonuclease [Egibacteraceae bacterium]
MAAATRMSVEEFLERDWPRGTQLIRGEVVVNQPSLFHQLVCGRLHALLLAWVEAEPGRGLVALPVDVRLGDDLYAPDVWWMREQRRPDRTARGLEVAPDLVVEVRSPATWRYDIGVKRDTYEAAGVTELWLVDTAAESVIVYRRSSEAASFDIALELAGADELTSPLLPDFTVPVSRLFDH